MDDVPALLRRDFHQFRVEVSDAERLLVVPSLERPGHHYHITLYAYTMVAFSFVDLWSLLYRGERRPRDQTPRMVEMLELYLPRGEGAHRHAVQLFRHTLMHTSRPRVLTDKSGKASFPFLFHWRSAFLPRAQHYLVGPDGKFTFGLEYFIEDMDVMLEGLLRDAAAEIGAGARLASGWRAALNQELGA